MNLIIHTFTLSQNVTNLTLREEDQGWKTLRILLYCDDLNCSLTKTVCSSYPIDGFQKEIEVLKLAQGPHIVELLSNYNSTNNSLKCINVVSKWYEYRSMDLYLRNHPKISQNIAQKWVAQIANAMLFLHKKLLFHGDLTDRNMLINKNFDMFVCDFGMAVKFDQINEKFMTDIKQVRNLAQFVLKHLEKGEISDQTTWINDLIDVLEDEKYDVAVQGMKDILDEVGMLEK